MTSITSSKCRHCKEPLSLLFCDLGATPVSNDYIRAEGRYSAEPYYPLRAFCCKVCRLVQLEDFRRASDLFREDYAYFSSVSTSWVEHAGRYAEAMTDRYGLKSDSTVVEVASNDGYLLQFFARRSVRVLGVEPCQSVADHAIREHGIETRTIFFGEEVGARWLTRATPLI